MALVVITYTITKKHLECRRHRLMRSVTPVASQRIPSHKLLAPGMEGLLHEGDCYSDWLNLSVHVPPRYAAASIRARLQLWVVIYR